MGVLYIVFGLLLMLMFCLTYGNDVQEQRNITTIEGEQALLSVYVFINNSFTPGVSYFEISWFKMKNYKEHYIFIYEWKQDSEGEILNMDETAQLRTDTVNQHLTLRINDTFMEDSGLYMCQVLLSHYPEVSEQLSYFYLNVINISTVSQSTASTMTSTASTMTSTSSTMTSKSSTMTITEKPVTDMATKTNQLAVTLGGIVAFLCFVGCLFACYWFWKQRNKHQRQSAHVINDPEKGPATYNHLNMNALSLQTSQEQTAAPEDDVQDGNASSPLLSTDLVPDDHSLQTRQEQTAAPEDFSGLEKEAYKVVTECVSDSRRIGQRSHYAAVYKYDEGIAVKSLAIKHMDWKAVMKEIKAIVCLKKHENILPVHCCFFHSGQLLVVMEHCPVSVYHFLKDNSKYKEDKITVEDKMAVLQQIFGGLEHLHEHSIVHKSIKPSNVRFTGRAIIKLSDCGSTNSCDYSCTCAISLVPHSTLYYKALELSRDNHHPQPCSDIWSASLLGIEWCNEQKAWTDSGENSYEIMKTKEHIPELHGDVSRNVFKILSDGMNYISDDRPRACHIKEQLKQLKQLNS